MLFTKKVNANHVYGHHKFVLLFLTVTSIMIECLVNESCICINEEVGANDDTMQ